MKSFKKVMAGMLMGIMVIGMLTGCGGDPVADDFEKFLNTDMVDVNANYDKIKEESAKWGDLETNEEIKDSINNGIDFIQDYHIIIHPRCVNFITEISNYTWDTDTKTGKKINRPIDDFNHLMDAMQYAFEDISRGDAFSFD